MCVRVNPCILYYKVYNLSCNQVGHDLIGPVPRVVNLGTSSKLCKRYFVPALHTGTLETVPKTKRSKQRSDHVCALDNQQRQRNLKTNILRLQTEENMVVTQVVDYLTCGSCLREFPLQKITAFIQHKKLDCDDDNDGSDNDPELQCSYCPRGFMTAWGLLIHAQLTHNLKIFLEKASKSLLEQSKLSHFSPGTQFCGSKLQTIPSGSLQSGTLAVPIADSLQPSVSDLVSACVSSAVYGTAISSQRSASDMDKNISITTDYVTGNSNVLGRETGVLGTELSQSGNQVNGRTLKGILYSNLPESDTSQSVQVHQKIVAVPCQQPNTPLAVQKTVQNVLNSDLVINGPFRSRSNTLPNIPRHISDRDSSQNVFPSQQVVNCDTVILPEKSADDKKETDISPMQSRNSGAGTGCLKDNLMTCQKELRTESIHDSNLHEEGKTIESAIMRNIEHVQQSAEFEQSANSLDTSSVTEKLLKSITDNSELERVEIDRNTEEQENKDGSVNDEGDKIEPCCDNQGCGITVIPGSHQTLQKCCNAVVPKKRKRHFETKHMPFSWSSSRYAKRRHLQSSRDRQFPSCSSSKSGYNVQGGSTIYIDVEPDSFVSSLGKSTSQVESTVQVTQSQFSTPRISSSERSGRPRSLILRPGAVVSIPLTYTIPVSNSASLLMPGQVSQQPLASIPTESHDMQTGTQSLSVDTKEAVEQSVGCSTAASLVSTDNDSSDAFEVKPLIDGVSRRRKYPTSKPFKCEVCEVAFNQRIHLKKHMSKHTGVKPFKCGQCDYSTVERSHLKVHIRIHTGEKPFKCTYCEYATAQNSTLKIHLKRHHGGRMFQCPNCSKEFTQQTQLTDHEWEHSPPDSSSKQQINKTSACKTVMKTEVFEDHSSQQENTSASSSLLKPPLQQEALTVSNADVGHVIPATNSSEAVGHVTQASGRSADLESHMTPATSSSTGLGHAIPSASDEDFSHVIPAANGSADCGHVMLATNSSTALNHVIPVSNSGTDLGHMIAIPSASGCMTDNEAADLLNSLTAKLLEEAEQAAQGHTD